jgi:hypothetical protein
MSDAQPNPQQQPSADPVPPVPDHRKDLELRLEAMREKNRKLRAQLDIQHTKNDELHASLVASSVSVEMEEEHISNHLLRRLDALRKDKHQLDAQLLHEEKQKEEKEQLLEKLKKNRVALERHLRQEEVEIAEKLQKQLHHTQVQRMELQSKVTAESATLQQLHDCIRSLRDGCRPSPALSPAKQPVPPPLTMHLESSTTAGTAHSDPNEGSSGTDGLMMAPLSGSTTSVLRSTGAIGDTADASPLACRSPSTTSVVAASRDGGNAVTTPLGCSGYSEGTPLSSRRSFTADNGMLRLLESEIQVAESLRRDAERRVKEYGERVAKLKTEIADAEGTREAQRATADSLRAELVRTTSAVSEIHANQEVAAEWTLDREVLGGGIGAYHPRSSSLCSTVSSHSLAAMPETHIAFSEAAALYVPKVLHAVHQPSLAHPPV